MAFVVGDRVRYNPAFPAAGLPEWRDRAGEIVKIKEQVPGQPAKMFGDIRMDFDGSLQEGINLARLIPA
jgi:hypothetical protein